MMQSNAYAEVAFDAQAATADKDFNASCDDAINSSQNAMAEVWNRAHLKARRVAAILAVGKNHINPVITLEDYSWAEQLIRRDIEGLTHRVEIGAVGGHEARRVPAIEEAIKDYVAMSRDKKVSTYKVPKAIADHPHVIPYTFFRRRFKHHAAFAADPRGMVNAIKAALQDAVELGLLQKMGNDQKLQFNGLRADSDCYVISEPG